MVIGAGLWMLLYPWVPGAGQRGSEKGRAEALVSIEPVHRASKAGSDSLLVELLQYGKVASMIFEQEHTVLAKGFAFAQVNAAFAVALDSCAVMTQHLAQKCSAACAVMSEHLAQGCFGASAVAAQHWAQGSCRVTNSVPIAYRY